MDLVVVPAAAPRTKPKACNYGLLLAKGEFIVVYDAEDAPEADQLRKAATAFAAGDERLACLQARLNYYNAEENVLTRLFALEYALWFDTLLPALETLKMPIPLGGTSNFFRTDVLRRIGGWDPFNVTEDADLGLRLARLGYRTQMLDSTTFEEANCRLPNWIRQRSRWVKGHMQTWVVHARRPREFARACGWRGAASLHLFLAGNVVTALLNPLLWCFAIWNAATGAQGLAPLAGWFALVAGNAFFIAMMAAAPLRRGWKNLAPFAVAAPLYWMLASVAAAKALHQIATRPWFWEKTDHVLSAAAKQRRNAALDGLAA
jgi:cellulose synthase/poly-beta-1,6-N-acetylglucosamine synthase-like glycosyltransferase